jgi:hypothetical protein
VKPESIDQSNSAANNSNAAAERPGLACAVWLFCVKAGPVLFAEGNGVFDECSDDRKRR